MTFLAIRYLLARRKQTFFTLLGIFFGTLAFVTISGLMIGFRTYLVEQLVNNDAHVHIQSREDFLTTHSLDNAFYGRQYNHVFWSVPPSDRKDDAMVENPQIWYRRLKSDPGVVAYSPQLTSAVMFTNGKAIASSTLVGCDPIAQAKVTTIGQYITEGSFKELAIGGNRLVLGRELQRKLGVVLLQNVMVSLPNSTPTPFKVVGIFKTGSIRSDNIAYGLLGDVQKVNLTPNQVNEIGVRLHDYSKAKIYSQTWNRFGPEKIESWDEQNANIFSVFKIQDTIRFMPIGAVMIVAAFGIYNILNMSVIQKRKDIAILGSLGYTPGDIVSLFFYQGLILGLIGSSLGLICGNLVCRYLKTISFGDTPMGGGSGYLQVSLDPSIYLQAAILALASACIASILPAMSAGKLTPIEIIRTGAE